MATKDLGGSAVVVPESFHPLRPALRSLLPWLETACIACLAALLLWKGIIPGWRFLNSDFPNYYLVARLLREGYSLDRIYDWIWLERIKDHWGLDQALVGFAGLTPFSALPIVPFSMFSAIVAKRLWILASLLFLCFSVELLNRSTSLGRRRIWLLALLAVFPLRTSFLLGQMHLLVLFLLVAAYYFYRQGRQVSCSFCLAIAGVLKVYPLLLGGYFLCKRQWRPAFALLCFLVILIGVGYFWIGSNVMDTYATEILPRSLQGEVLDPYSVHAASGAAFFHRLFIAEPALNPHPFFNSPPLYAVLYPLWQLIVIVPLFAISGVRPRDPVTDRLEWAAFVIALLVLSPVPSSYHFVVIIFSIVLLVDVLRARKEYGVAALLIFLYSLFSAIEFLPILSTRPPNMFAGFARLWIALVMWAVFLFCMRLDQAERRLLVSDTLRNASLCTVVVVAWATQGFGYRRHFAHLQQEMSRRLPTSASSYLASGPRPTSAGFVFTAMLPEGYRVLDQTGRPLSDGSNDSAPLDQLSVAATPTSPILLLELADHAGSQIVAISGASSAAYQLFFDAESPAISSDQRHVVFIRELKGRGTLWIASFDPSLTKLESGPAELVDSSYDVRDVAIAPTRILFSAKMNGRSAIFRITPGGKPTVFLSADTDVDSPAFSPDERLLAFRKRVHHRWQLGYLDIESGNERMLTFGDCNAYTPAWLTPRSLAYATDCGRGLGLSALASVDIKN